MTRGDIGIQIGASTSAAELGAIAAEAERLGYCEIWLAEDYFELGGIASVASALAATDQIPVGLGVVAAPVRHPAVLAMEFATLSEAFPHRFMAGIGHGSPGWVRQMGLAPRSPLGLLREATESTRQLLAGAELTEEGEYFQFDQVHLDRPPGEPTPIYLGVHGPASLRLSGELVEGTLLGWFSSPGYVAWARERIAEGRDRSDRSGHHQLVALCVISISDVDASAARRDLGRWVAPMLSSMAGSPQVTASARSRELLELLGQGDEQVLIDGITDGLLSEFVAAGDSESCAATIERLLEAGADRVVVVPNPAGYRTTSSMVEQMKTAAKLLS